MSELGHLDDLDGNVYPCADIRSRYAECKPIFDRLQGNPRAELKTLDGAICLTKGGFHGQDALALLGQADWAEGRMFPGSAYSIPGSASEFPGSVGYRKLFASD
jgi:hypothetical protein